MATFLVLYRAEIAALETMAEMTPEQSQEGMALWMRWAQSCGDALVDLGAPVGAGNHLAARGAGSVAPSSTTVCGFTIMQAGTLEQVTAMLEDHPHFHTPGSPSIDVLPFMAIPGM